MVERTTMEKQAKLRNNILKLLPKAAAAVNFQNPPFSPGRDNIITKLKPHAAAVNNKGFSGHFVSLIPHEARIRKSKNESFGAQEPTSPKVSCMGQIKHKNIMTSKKPPQRTVSLPPDRSKPALLSPRMVKKHASKIKKMFSSAKLGRKSNASSVDDDKKLALADGAPRLSEMKRFASGRDAFASFDWTAQIAPEEVDHDRHQDYYPEEEEEEGDGGEKEEPAEAIVPFSAPIRNDGEIALEPRKEVNIWKRRTINPPRPLRII